MTCTVSKSVDSMCVCVCFQHINELTMKLDLQSILCGAEAIYLQLTNCKVRRDRYDWWYAMKYNCGHAYYIMLSDCSVLRSCLWKYRRFLGCVSWPAYQKRVQTQSPQRQTPFSLSPRPEELHPASRLMDRHHSTRLLHTPNSRRWLAEGEKMILI